MVSWRRRRAARAHDLSRCRRREHLDRATWAMGQLGPISTRGVPSAGPFPRVLAHDPADSLRLRYHNVGSPRTSAGGSLIGLRWGIHPERTSDARMLASPAPPYLPPRFAQSQRKTQGNASAADPLASHRAATSFTCGWRRAVRGLDTGAGGPAALAVHGSRAHSCMRRWTESSNIWRRISARRPAQPVR